MNKRLISVAAAVLVSACGGGDRAAEPMTPAAAVARLRTALLAINAADVAVTPEEAARQLLDFAEASDYKIYFPSHEVTQASPPFLYRHYPNGVYLGVVVTAGPDFTLNGVYVIGGPFGTLGVDKPIFVGLLTRFITPVAPPPTTGSNNGCYDLALFETPGTHAVLAYQYSGVSSGTGTVEWTVNPLTTFAGASAYETALHSVQSLSSDSGTFSNTADIKSYAKRTGDAEVTQYGFDSSSVNNPSPLFSSTSLSHGVYTPPFVDRQYGLALGGSITQSSTLTTTSTTSISGFPPSTTTHTGSETTTTRFVSIETITVPAGTYSTCKFELTFAAAPGDVSTQWVLRGKGIPVQSISGSGSTVATQKATSITLNGARL